MIIFEEEVAKFEPVLEVENVEEAAKSYDLADILDLLKRPGSTQARESSGGEE